MSEVKKFVDDLIDKSVVLKVVDGQLKIDGPATVLNETTCVKLRHLKPEIIDYITLQRKLIGEVKEQAISKASAKNFPLSYTQLCFWFVYFALGETANNLSRLLFKSPVRSEDVEKALHNLISKHAIFNVSMGEIVPLQRLKKTPLSPLKVTDLQAFGSVQQNDAVAKEVVHLMRPFDLSNPPLVRYQYYQLTKDESLLVCCFPHIVLDGAAIHLFEQELMRTLSTATETKDVAYDEPYTLYQHIVNQRVMDKHNYSEQLSFWKDSLAGFGRAQFPAMYINRGNQRYVDREILIPETFLAQLHQCCVKNRVSMQMVIVTIICQSIRNITSQTRFVVNSVMENRISDHEAKLMAPVLYLLPTPVEVLQPEDFEQTLEQVKKHNKIAQDNMDISFSVPQGILAAKRWRGINKPLALMIKLVSRILSFALPSAKLFPSYWSDYFLTANPPFVTKHTSDVNKNNKPNQTSGIAVVDDPVININLLPNTYKPIHSKTAGNVDITSLSNTNQFLPNQALDGDWEAESIDFYVSKNSNDDLVFRVTCCCLNDLGVEKVNHELQQRMSDFVV
jgi:hypothetical protein